MTVHILRLYTKIIGTFMSGAVTDQMSLFDKAALVKSATLQISPKHTTHTGGKGELLHDWFAYLEGFSSKFVRDIYQTYMPEAKCVLEPFAGVGTTPLTLGMEGVDTFYCEVNPAMRRVINAKVIIASLPKDKKRIIHSDLLKLSDEFLYLLEKAPTDKKLDSTYKAAFKNSIFFEPETYDKILKMRTINDEIIRTNPLVGALLQIAVISKILDCSKLKRAGDVRYKTEKELLKGTPDIVESVVRHLRLMAADCLRCPEATGFARLACTNAKQIQSLDSFSIDGVITSPPYLNGTNYFRNTKLELWYMRDIVNNTSLRGFRDEVITSGINDVTTKKGNFVHPKVTDIVSDLEKNSYDQRIARMVAGYFEEMELVIKGLAHHLINGSKACIDIGDSSYAGIYIPTHDILSAIADEHGLKTLETITLRKRKSRDQSELSQSLIVLEKSTSIKHGNSSSKSIETNPMSKANSHLIKWEIFKDTLPHMRHPYSKRNWGNGLHSVCSYQGKMKPALAYHLIDTFTSVGDRILDPFSGSGTIPFEAALNGRTAFGLDIGLLASSVSNAKLKKPNKEIVSNLISNLDDYIKNNEPSDRSLFDSQEVQFNKTIPEYYHEKTLHEILLARDFFSQNQDPENAEWALVLASLLHILHGNRPYALSRNSHPITPYAPTGEYIYKNLVQHLWDKVNRSLDTDRPSQFINGHCFTANILHEWPQDIHGLDAIITSPPFFDSTKFYMTNWLRYWFCGWTKQDFTDQPKSFIEVIQKQSFDAYDFIFSMCSERLKDGGVAVFHLGHSDKCNMLEALLGYTSKYFKVRDSFTESVEHCEKHGITDKGGVKGHQYLVLEK
jgi:DNA modification methylase